MASVARMPPTASAMRRALIDPRIMWLSRGWASPSYGASGACSPFHDVAEAALRAHEIGPHFSPDPSHDDLQRVAVGLAVVGVDVLGEFRLGNHAVGVVHEVAEQPVFER